VEVLRIAPGISEMASSRGAAVRVAEIRLGGVPRGAAVVLCDARALEHEVAEVLNGLAEHGYESLAADLSPAGPARDDELLSDVGVLLGRLAERGWEAEQIGLIGYGSGGRLALLAAAEFGLGAAVSVAPTGLRAPAVPLRAPWLGLFGDLDENVPPSAVRELREALNSGSPVHTELVGYPGAGAAFHRDSPQAQAHAAAFDSWQRTVEWLNLRVVPAAGTRG
jgi:carboxymethylenebutenolidase